MKCDFAKCLELNCSNVIFPSTSIESHPTLIASKSPVKDSKQPPNESPKLELAVPRICQFPSRLLQDIIPFKTDNGSPYWLIEEKTI